MADTPKHPPMTFREAVKQDRAYSRVRPCTEREYAEWDRARAIVDQAVKAHKLRCEVCDAAERLEGEDFDYDMAHEAAQEFQKLRALERGESEAAK